MRARYFVEDSDRSCALRRLSLLSGEFRPLMYRQWSQAVPLLVLVMLLGLSAYAQTEAPDAAPPPSGESPTQPDAMMPSGVLPLVEPMRVSEPVQPAPSVKAQLPENPSTDWGGLAFPLIRTVGGLGLVLSLILAACLAFKKFAPHYFGRQPKKKIMHLIETLSMGEKRSIAVVQVGGQNYLVGNTPNQISLLASLNEREIPILPESKGSSGSEPSKRNSGPAKKSFLKLYNMEKHTPGRKANGPSVIPPDIRGKMRELRQTLEG